jgi:hypothetical protein
MTEAPVEKLLDLARARFVRLRPAWLLPRLLQRGERDTTAYSEEAGSGSDLPARGVDAKSHSVQSPPRWKPSEAYWPTYHDGLMSFVGQVMLPENDVTD